MKKLIAFVLCLVMVMAVFAGCGNKNDVQETIPEAMDGVVEAPVEDALPQETAPEETAPQETAPQGSEEQAPASTGALAVLNKIWEVTGENEKFPAAGGDVNNMVDGAPGNYSLEDAEALTYQLLVPADQVANIDDAAALFHGMMLNNFTCGVFHVNGDAKAFGDAMYDAIKNNQWMCGFPETMIVAVIDGEYVPSGFGINDIMKPFVANLKEAHQNLEILYLEDVA